MRAVRKPTWSLRSSACARWRVKFQLQRKAGPTAVSTAAITIDHTKVPNRIRRISPC